MQELLTDLLRYTRHHAARLALGIAFKLDPGCTVHAVIETIDQTAMRKLNEVFAPGSQN